MAGDWIKMRAELYTHPKFVSLCTELIYRPERPGLLVYVCGPENLGIGVMPPSNRTVTEEALRLVTERSLRDVCLCALLRVWCAVNAHCKVDGGDAVLSPMALSELDDVAGVHEFGAALEEVGWVVERDANTLVFPNFLEYNTPACMRPPEPMTNAERQRAYRRRQKAMKDKADGNGCVTKSNGRLEKRREEKEDTPNPKNGPTKDEFVSAWNTIGGFVPMRAMTGKRFATFQARRKDAAWCRDWRAALDKASRLPFCLGSSDSGWRATADWFLRPDTVTKILEGVYDALGGKGPPPKPKLTDEQRAEQTRRQREASAAEAAQSLPLEELSRRLQGRKSGPGIT